MNNFTGLSHAELTRLHAAIAAGGGLLIAFFRQWVSAVLKPQRLAALSSE